MIGSFPPGQAVAGVSVATVIEQTRKHVRVQEQAAAQATVHEDMLDDAG